MEDLGFLAISLLALLFGPLIYAMARDKDRMLSLAGMVASMETVLRSDCRIRTNTFNNLLTGRCT